MPGEFVIVVNSKVHIYLDVVQRYLPRNMAQWWAFVNIQMKPRLSENAQSR